MLCPAGALCCVVGAMPAPASAKAAERTQQEIADDEDDDSADAEAAGDERQQAAEAAAAESAAAEAHSAAAGVVGEIAALALVAEPHRALLLPLPNASHALRLQFEDASTR